VLVKSPMAAARRSTGDPLPRKHEPTATSGKSLLGRTVTNYMLSPHIRARSRLFPVPHTREAGTASPRKRKRPPFRTAVAWTPW
jgi:hypothetical protein